MIKHVSFDVWNTLITANPAYAMYRTKFLALALNMDVDFVKRAYTKVKQCVDQAAEHSGEAFTTDQVFSLLYKSMGLFVSPGLHGEIRAMTEELFRKNPPTLGAGVADLFVWLRGRGITTSIGSNSNFISGTVMRPFLEEALNHKFLTAVFSDLISYGKPSPVFFDAVAFKINVFRDPPIDRSEILHVGDHQLCDVEGAHDSGMHGLLITSPDQLCEQVKLRIESVNELDVSLTHLSTTN